MNWNELGDLTEPTWVDMGMLFKLMLSSDKMDLSGWASEGDPIFKTLEPIVDQRVTKSYYEETSSLIGGVCINGVVIVFLHDPSDGYRSYLSQALIVPNEKLTTTFSPVPIRAVPTDTQNWEDPQQPDDPSMLDLVSVDVGKPVWCNWVQVTATVITPTACCILTPKLWTKPCHWPFTEHSAVWLAIWVQNRCAKYD